MFNLLVGSFGFRTTFTITFEKILPPRFDGAPPVTIPLPTIVPIKRSFFDADITVEMTRDTGTKFTAVIHGLGDDVYRLLEPQKTLVHISLGYADGTEAEVVAGVLQKKSQKAGDGFYDVTLSGIDYVFDRLQCPQKPISYQSQTNKTIGDIAREVCQVANVPAKVKITGPELKPISFVGVSPLLLLRELTNRAQDPTAPVNIQLQIKDGTVWIGTPADIGSDHPAPVDDVGDDAPLTTSGDCMAQSPPDGKDFKIAGDPSLRPNDTITFNGTQYRLEKVTHTLSGNGGYVVQRPGAEPGGDGGRPEERRPARRRDGRQDAPR